MVSGVVFYVIKIIKMSFNLKKIKNKFSKWTKSLKNAKKVEVDGIITKQKNNKN